MLPSSEENQQSHQIKRLWEEEEAWGDEWERRIIRGYDITTGLSTQRKGRSKHNNANDGRKGDPVVFQ